VEEADRIAAEFESLLRYRDTKIPMEKKMPKPSETKSFTLRLPAPLADELATVAEVDSVPVQQAVRDAIVEHIAARRKDKTFQDRLRASAERHREILERLAR